MIREIEENVEEIRDRFKAASDCQRFYMNFK